MSKSLLDYPYVIEVLSEEIFKDLWSYDEVLRSGFYVQRIEEANRLLGRVESLGKYGGNILVVGDAGSGKTCFLKWFLRESEFAKSSNPNHYFLNLKSRAEDGTKEHFLANLEGELTKVAKNYLALTFTDHCNDIPNSPKDFDECYLNYIKITDKLRNYSEKTQEEKDPLFLFVDDIDYVDEDYFEDLILILKPFLLSKFICVVLAGRVPAYNAIMSHEDYVISGLFEESLRISHLPVQDVMSRRLRLICSSDADTKIKMIDLAKKVINNSILERVIAVLNSILKDEEIPDDLESIQYPFTYLQHAYMQELSNGNVRYMLLMAKEFLKYMSKNKNTIEVTKHGYCIGRLANIKHFFRDIINEKIKIHNLHSRKSHQFLSEAERKKQGIDKRFVGNSLYVVILEFLGSSKSNGEMTSDGIDYLMYNYGFKEASLREGLQSLQKMEMIESKLLNYRRAFGSPPTNSFEYNLTRRGRYYIDYLIHWDEYIDEFKRSQHNVLGHDIETKHSIQYSVLDFLIKIFITRKNMGFTEQDVKISKVAFLDTFVMQYKELLVKLDKTDKKTAVPLTTEDISEILITDLQVAEHFELEKHLTYLIYYEKVKNFCESYHLSFKVRPPYYKSGYEEFINMHVKPPEYEENNNAKNI